jgi:hypothetical protein
VGQEEGVKDIKGYFILLLDPGMKFSVIVRARLKGLLKYYKKTVIRTIVMPIIQELAPELYKEIVAVDPGGEYHIDLYERDSYAIVTPSTKDGLPEIDISFDFVKLPKNELRFLLAHELGHYVLGHPFNEPPLVHKALEKIVAESGKLPFKESFRHAFTRVQEFEADRFAVIEFGIPIDDAIVLMKKSEPGRVYSSIENYEYALKNPQKETFQSTHPLQKARIEQFEELRREVELNKIHGKQPEPIDWKKLAAHYLKGIQKK